MGFLKTSKLALAGLMVLGGCGRGDGPASEAPVPAASPSEDANPPPSTDSPAPPAAKGDGKPQDPAPPPAPPPVEPTIFAQDEGNTSKNGNFVVVLAWQSELLAEEYLNAKLTFADSLRLLPLTVTDVAFEPWMPSMGHGTTMDDQRVSEDAEAANVFLVKDAYLIMGGEWEIRVTATVNGVRDVALIKAWVN